MQKDFSSFTDERNFLLELQGEMDNFEVRLSNFIRTLSVGYNKYGTHAIDNHTDEMNKLAQDLHILMHNKSKEIRDRIEEVEPLTYKEMINGGDDYDY
jgi:hypothetical protein